MMWSKSSLVLETGCASVGGHNRSEQMVSPCTSSGPLMDLASKRPPLKETPGNWLLWSVLFADALEKIVKCRETRVHSNRSCMQQ